MVAEAQKMMKDPNFQKQMQTMMSQNGFQESLDNTKKELEDPEKLKLMEEKAMKAIEEGNIKLKEIEDARRKQIEENVRIARAKQIEDEQNKLNGITNTDENEQDQKQSADDNVKDEDDDGLITEMPALNLN